MLQLTYDPETGEADLAVENGAYVVDDTQRTLVVLSVGIDARADVDDVPPGTDRSGWCLEPLVNLGPEPIGSKLWLLEREKNTPLAERKAQKYATDAFDWWVANGLADRVEVTTERGERFLAIYLSIFEPGNPEPTEELIELPRAV